MKARKNMLLLFFGVFLFGMKVDAKTVTTQLEITPQSCLDYFKRGFKSNGFYTIYNFQNKDVFTAYCDMTSEAGSAWTLVMSYALKHRNMEKIAKKAMKQDEPVNENSPNRYLYRMSLSQMNHLKSQSTHWRTTCGFPIDKVDYTDYVRAKFSDFDIMTFLGVGVCKKVEFVNIRGYECAQCTTQWWQKEDKWSAHIDSSHTGCHLDPSRGSVGSENNFGFYSHTYNPKFRCSAKLVSTTNWWFGGYL